MRVKVFIYKADYAGYLAFCRRQADAYPPMGLLGERVIELPPPEACAPGTDYGELACEHLLGQDPDLVRGPLLPLTSPSHSDELERAD